MYRLLVALLLPLSRLATAQAVLSGTVLDSLTHQPLPFASVFLATTTLGATTNEQGHFDFARIPLGSYDLVASYVGYSLGKQRVVIAAGAAPQQLTFSLLPSANHLGEVVVRASNPHRADDYRKFKELFLGSTSFSKQCSIVNHKDLDVYYDVVKRELNATASNYIQVDNQALGYHIKYYGLRFRCQFAQDIISFYGQPVFEEMTPRNERQQQIWVANRATAYYGSLTHFLKSVYDNQVQEAGFLMQQVRLIPNTHLAHNDSMRLALLHKYRYTRLFFTPAEEDSISKWVKAPKAFAVLHTAARPIDSVRRVSTDKAHIFLRFTQELQVAYFGETPDPLYRIGMATIGPPGAPAPRNREVSRLRLLVPEAEIQPNGKLLNPIAVFTSEYMGFEKMGEFLPVNYVPPASPSHP
ncbi:carboxypeptidase-like regulatory domain-containing protein [Hymenobacter baengnokdamensis]|uniref:carboxypeptidase-like regulatory domain-containing protein n=1 Tax=Hymenobacter baengnokdamensis TaxID=2615203 RepID=UPI001245A125|nr:carboxypeptidase-like regulatory domain-containing protein [Hymenobacter baengnokdamensis]